MDTAHQWPHQDQNQIAAPSDPYNSSRSVEEKTVKPQKDQAPLNCPRCNSINTKFCYFNNYSLTQPRHFCKNCRRYWTAGGSLRNVPVGGGSRKNKHRSSTVVASNNFVSKNDHHLSQFSFQNPNNFDTNNIQLNLNSSYNSSSCSTTSAMELLRNSTTEFASRGLNSYMSASIQNPNMVMYASGFNFQEFNKQQAGGFSVNHDHGPGNGYNNRENNINGAVDRRFVFPFGEFSKQISSRINESDQNKQDGNPSLYWNGMSGGGSW